MCSKGALGVRGGGRAAAQARPSARRKKRVWKRGCALPPPHGAPPPRARRGGAQNEPSGSDEPGVGRLWRATAPWGRAARTPQSKLCTTNSAAPSASPARCYTPDAMKKAPWHRTLPLTLLGGRPSAGRRVRGRRGGPRGCTHGKHDAARNPTAAPLTAAGAWCTFQGCGVARSDAWGVGAGWRCPWSEATTLRCTSGLTCDALAPASLLPLRAWR